MIITRRKAKKLTRRIHLQRFCREPKTAEMILESGLPAYDQLRLLLNPWVKKELMEKYCFLLVAGVADKTSPLWSAVVDRDVSRITHKLLTKEDGILRLLALYIIQHGTGSQLPYKITESFCGIKGNGELETYLSMWDFCLEVYKDVILPSCRHLGDSETVGASREGEADEECESIPEES